MSFALQSTSTACEGLHVALVLDGNGRWAARHGLPRLAGHSAGIRVVRRVVEAAPGLGIGTLTLFAFSSDNWRRPETEVHGLLGLLRRYLDRETAACVERGIRLTFPGRRDRLPPDLARALSDAERTTAGGHALRLRVAIDYSARDVILRAAAQGARAAGDRETFLAALAEAAGEPEPAPEVDLLIRTGGERRLSDFLLFECAYAELEFLDLHWPEFGPEELAACLERFRGRERRFGGLGALGAASEES